MNEIIDISKGIMTIYNLHIVPDNVLFASEYTNENPDTVILMKEALQNQTKLQYMCMNSKEVGYWFEFVLCALIYAKKNDHPELVAVCDKVITTIFNTFGTEGFVYYGNSLMLSPSRSLND